MRKYLHILFLLLLPLFSCTREVEWIDPAAEEADDAPDGRVTVTFTCALPAAESATKADSFESKLGEDTYLESLHLAVYGSSGYFKEYIEATPMKLDSEGKPTIKLDSPNPVKETRQFFRDKLDENGDPVYEEDGVTVQQEAFYKEVDSYIFQADLKLSNTERIIHFIGNGPESIRTGKHSEVLPGYLSEEGKTGFWQMVKLSKITAKQEMRDGKWVYINTEGGVYNPLSGTDKYVVSDETQNAFKKTIIADDGEKPIYGNGFALIRNWAKITLKNVAEKKEGETVIQKGSNFTPISFAVIHVPKQGTLVPYGGTEGFIENYQTKSFVELTETILYKGNLPEDKASFDETIPSLEDFKQYKNGVKKYVPGYDIYSASYDSTLDSDSEPAVYLYERPVPTENLEPSYVLVYGTYYRKDDPIFMGTWEAEGESGVNGNGLTKDEFENGVECFYKIDLMSGGEYYPILRNFKYQVQIKSITARGQADPETAAESAGSADVSADIHAAHLTDISDGVRRMAIQPWLAKTFIKAETVEDLSVKFINDISNGNPNPKSGIGETSAAPWINYDADAVTWSFEPDGQDNGVIDKGTIKIGDPQKNQLNPDDNGWRTITFNVKEPDLRISKTQILRIKCKNLHSTDSEEPTLYRDIVVTLQPRQPMRVECSPKRIPRQAGEKQTVTISIPDGLVKSMFPLEFILEPEDATLTPSKEDGTENLPVTSGSSIIPEKEGKVGIQFLRTVSWEDYEQTTVEKLTADDSRWRNFTSHFVTNCADCATTVWVADKRGYFRTGENDNDNFTTYRSFRTPVFTTSVPREIGGTVKVSTGVYAEDIGQSVLLILKNMVPADGDDFTADKFTKKGDGVYEFTPTKENFVLAFKTTALDGDVSLRLSSSDAGYEEQYLEPWHFDYIDHWERKEGEPLYAKFSEVARNYQYGWSYVVFGQVVNQRNNSYQVPMGFGYDLAAKEFPAVELVESYLIGLGTGKKKWTPTVVSETGVPNYTEKTVNSSNDNGKPVSARLTAVGYVEETFKAKRFTGNIYTETFSPSDFKSKTSVNKTGSHAAQSTLNVTFDELPGQNDGTAGLVLAANETHTITFSSSTNPNQTLTAQLYYVHINYLANGANPSIPAQVDVMSPDGSSYYAYMGNNYEYCFVLPQGQQSGQLRLRAPYSKPIIITSIVLRSFAGTLSE